MDVFFDDRKLDSSIGHDSGRLQNWPSRFYWGQAPLLRLQGNRLGLFRQAEPKNFLFFI